MEPRTQEYLAKADHHRDVARALIGPLASSISRPPPPDWAVVAAFYAAVHYVNAYLWEALRYEPGDHSQRSSFVARTRALRPAAQAYELLKDRAYQARYGPHYNPCTADSEAAVRRELEQVRRAALIGLGLTP